MASTELTFAVASFTRAAHQPFRMKETSAAAERVSLNVMPEVPEALRHLRCASCKTQDKRHALSGVTLGAANALQGNGSGGLGGGEAGLQLREFAIAAVVAGIGDEGGGLGGLGLRLRAATASSFRRLQFAGTWHRAPDRFRPPK